MLDYPIIRYDDDVVMLHEDEIEYSNQHNNFRRIQGIS